MNQIPSIPGSKRLNEFERRNLEEQLAPLRRSLECFPGVTTEQTLEPAGLIRAEAWAKSTTIYIYNIFRALVAIPYRIRQMDQAIQHTRQSFHAVFELVFCSIRDAKVEDFQRAKLAVATVVNSCSRLV